MTKRAEPTPSRSRLPVGFALTAALLAALLGGGGCRPAPPAGGTSDTAAGSAAGFTADTVTAPAADSTVFGYLRSEQEAAARVILVAHRHSRPPVPGVTRTRAEARELASRLAAAARERERFTDLARRHSDDALTAARGGYAGIIRKGSWPLALELALFQLPVGEISAPVETDRGFVILMRLPVKHLRAHHILIAWRGARRAGPSVTRTPEQARLLAEEVRRLALARHSDLCDLAARYSDDLDNRFRCGLLGDIDPYSLDDTLSTALIRLRPGEISPPIRSPFGYHLLWRESSSAPDRPAAH